MTERFSRPSDFLKALIDGDAPPVGRDQAAVNFGQGQQQ